MRHFFVLFLRSPWVASCELQIQERGVKVACCDLQISDRVGAENATLDGSDSSNAKI